MQNTVTATMARWAEKLEYDQISPEAVHEAKRYMLDSIGCALGGYVQHDLDIARSVLKEIAAPGPATVIGSGEKLDVVSASLVNALMVRSMDYNDIYWKQDPSHPSDIIPAAIAACERIGSGGKELITGIVLGHEFEMRFCEMGFPGVEERGWHHATLTAFVSPIVAGRALRLNAAQIQNAIGISGCRHVTLGSVSAGELTMMKNTADPMATQSGVLAALLAEKGYTGPGHIIDGMEGFVHCMGEGWKLNILTDSLGESWRILQCGMKGFPTEALTHAPISALLHIVKTNDLQPEQIETVIIHTLSRAADILSDPSKYNPKDRETADHSLPYVISAAIVDRQVTPGSFTMEKIMDSRIRAQLLKVKLVGDKEIDAAFPRIQCTIVRVKLTDGRELSHSLEYPKGDPRDPLTDQEIEQKYASLSDGVLSKAEQTKLKDAIWNMEKFDTVAELMALTTSAMPRKH